MSSWHSPQSIYHCGHSAVKDIFNVPIQIQEKADGSFFAFGIYDELQAVPTNDPTILDTEKRKDIKIRSKGAVMYIDAPEKMFQKGADTVKALVPILHEEWQYRGEFLAKPKHNALAYDRVPKGNIILFDILTDEEAYLPYPQLVEEANRLGLEVVPQLAVYDENECTLEKIRALLETPSILGGQKIEGIVIKPLVPMFGRDKKMLFAKFVSEAYKEVHSSSWKADNPSNKDIIALIGAKFTTPARWHKAAQHLRDAGLLAEDVTDIGRIMKEVPNDVEKECKEEIKELLYSHAWPHIRRSLTHGLPEWWKELLLKRAFESEEISDDLCVQIQNK